MGEAVVRRHTLGEDLVAPPVAVRPSRMCRSDHAYSIPCQEAKCGRHKSVGVSCHTQSAAYMPHALGERRRHPVSLGLCASSCGFVDAAVVQSAWCRSSSIGVCRRGWCGCGSSCVWVRSLAVVSLAVRATTGVSRAIKRSGQEPLGSWPLLCGCVVAVSYSPTTCRLQYHWRCRA